MSTAVHAPIPEAWGPLYFVVGCPRSGTFLVASILNRSGSIAIPTETHFVALFPRFLWLAGDWRRPPARRRAARAVCSFLRVWMQRSEEQRDLRAMTRHSLLAVAPAAEELALGSASYAEFVARLFAAYAQGNGAALAGDKSAYYRHVALGAIDRAVGGRARFIHVLRDGRDTWLSWRRWRWGPPHPAEAGRLWAEHVREKRRWGREHPDRYCELRYEDLLRQPEAELRRLCGFVGLDYSPDLLRFHEQPYAADLANSRSHQKLGQPLDPSNTGKWRQEMNPGEIAPFEHIARAELAAAGYPLATSPAAGLRAWRLTTRAWFQRALAAGSLRHLQLGLKALLPAAALVSLRLGFPLERLCNSRAWLAVERGLTGPPKS